MTALALLGAIGLTAFCAVGGNLIGSEWHGVRGDWRDDGRDMDRRAQAEWWGAILGALAGLSISAALWWLL